MGDFNVDILKDNNQSKKKKKKKINKLQVKIQKKKKI